MELAKIIVGPAIVAVTNIMIALLVNGQIAVAWLVACTISSALGSALWVWWISGRGPARAALTKLKMQHSNGAIMLGSGQNIIMLAPDTERMRQIEALHEALGVPFEELKFSMPKTNST